MVSTRSGRGAKTPVKEESTAGGKPAKTRVTIRRPAKVQSPQAAPAAEEKTEDTTRTAAVKRTRRAAAAAAPAPPAQEASPLQERRKQQHDVRTDTAVADAAAAPLPDDPASPPLPPSSPSLPKKRARIVTAAGPPAAAPVPATIPTAPVPATIPPKAAITAIISSKPKPAKKGSNSKGSKPCPNIRPALLLLAVLVTTTAGAWAYAACHPGAAAGLQLRALHAKDAVAAAAKQAGARAAAAAAAAQSIGLQALDGAQQRLGEVQGWALSNAANVYDQVTAATLRLPGFSRAAEQAAGGAWDAAEIAAILPEGAAWGGVAADIAHRLNAQRAAATLLLACATEGDCADATAALAALRGTPSGCVQLLDAAAMAEGPLAAFVESCPLGGLLVLRDAQRLPPEAVPSLRVVPPAGAIVLLVQLRSAVDARGAAMGDPSESAAWLKDMYFNGMLGSELQGLQDAERAGAVLLQELQALRDRVEFAAPVRLSAAAQVQADGEMDGGDDKLYAVEEEAGCTGEAGRSDEAGQLEAEGGEGDVEGAQDGSYEELM